MQGAGWRLQWCNAVSSSDFHRSGAFRHQPACDGGFRLEGRPRHANLVVGAWNRSSDHRPATGLQLPLANVDLKGQVVRRAQPIVLWWRTDRRPHCGQNDGENRWVAYGGIFTTSSTNNTMSATSDTQGRFRFNDPSTSAFRSRAWNNDATSLSPMTEKSASNVARIRTSQMKLRG